MSPQFEIILIASFVAMACSLVGVFLVIKKLSMISDAISHTVLLGIVLVFLATKDVSSPWMNVGAIIMGLITVQIIQMIKNTGLVSEEASIGLVFPFIFSIAIVLISRYAGSIHLDTDAVLLGEIAFAPLNRMVLLGISIPKALVSAIGVFIINALVIRLFYKEFKISSFDAILATTLGFSPILLNIMLMSMVSLTSVSSFSAVGSILVIAFMIGPPLTANLLTHNFEKLVGLSLLIAVINVVVGYQFARILDVSIAGSMALVTGLTFTLAFFFSKEAGYLTRILRNKKQRKMYHEASLLLFIEEYPHSQESTLLKNFRFSERMIKDTLLKYEREGFVIHEKMGYYLSERGKKHVLELEKSIFER